MMMKKMCGVHKVAWVLLLVGGFNWLLVGVAGKDLFAMLGLGMAHVVARAVYILVGASALSMFGLGGCCMKNCHCGDKACDNCADCGKKDDKKMAPPAAMPPKA